MSLVIAIYQGQGVIRDVKENLTVMSQQAHLAADKGCALIVFPEMWLTGYNIKDEIITLSEPMDGMSFAEATKIAIKYSIALVYGYPEASGGKVYNSVMFIDSDGNMIQNYRKIHLFGPEEKKYFTPGNEILPPVSMKGKQFGIGICYDIEFPEFARIHALRGTEILLIPSANWDPTPNKILAPARAAENNIFVAYVNRTGPEDGEHFIGQSSVTDPLGNFLIFLDHDKPELALTSIQTVKLPFSYLQDRRPIATPPFKLSMYSHISTLGFL